MPNFHAFLQYLRNLNFLHSTATNFACMRIFLSILLLLSFSCGGSLSTEQRKKIRANMEAKSIKKISDAELTEAALSYARNIIRVVEEKGQRHQSLLDSLDKVYDVQILVMKPDDSGLRAVE